jgi:hypothetical protein
VRRTLFAVMSLVLAAAPAARAQTLRATVTDRATDRPLSDVRITLLGPDNRLLETNVRSDSMGTFTTHVGWAGKYRMVATRIGYQSLTSDPIDVDLGQLVVLKLQMTSVPQQLATVSIVERRRLHSTELMTSGGFDLRHSRGVGTFVTAEQLASMGEMTLRDILAGYAPNVLWIQNTDNGDVLSILQAGSADGCAPEIFLDGLPLSTGVDIESLSGRRAAALEALSGYRADQLHGIEVYRWAQMPPPSMSGLLGAAQYEGSRTRRCGVVAIWTRHGIARNAAYPRRIDGRPAIQVIRGTVVDEERQLPIPNTFVRLADEKGKAFGETAHTDSAGRFIIRTTRAGPLRLIISGGAIRSATTPVIRVASEELIIVRLFGSASQRVAAPLGIAGRTSPRDFGAASLAAFHYRRERAIAGTFLGVDEIRRSGATTLGELVARTDTAGNARTSAAGAGDNPTAAGPARCAAGWFFNGNPAATDGSAGLQSMPIETVIGLEIYRSRDDAPEILTAAPPDCRIIGVWTTSAR